MIISNMLKIDNINIHFTKDGKGDPFILVHGMLFDSGGYKELIKLLSEKYTVYAIDLPMHGKSENPKKYLSIANMSSLLEDFIRILEIKNPIICGHSGGVLVAMNYALKNKFKELVIIEPPAIDLPLYLILIKSFLVEPFCSLFMNPIKTLIVIRVGLYNLIRNIFNKNYWKLINDRQNYDYSALIGKIKGPTKILWSKQDRCHDIENAFKLGHSNNFKIIGVTGTHFWPILDPKEVNKYLERVYS